MSQANISDDKNEYQWDAWDALIKGFGMHVKVTSIKNGMRLEKLMGLDGCNWWWKFLNKWSGDSIKVQQVQTYEWEGE